MPYHFLLIETATEVCSVALSCNEKIVSSIYLERGYSHTENLFPFIEKILINGKITIKEIDAVVLSIGPGSYTGLRIGASAAKGICYGLNIPLIAISTLQNIALGVINKQVIEEKAWVCPMIDARRMEVFTASFNNKGDAISEVESKIIDEHSFKLELENNIIYFCGNGMEKCKSILQHKNARFIDAPLEASNMLFPALKKYENRQFEDVAYFEPFYFKEYIAKKTVVKGLYQRL